jgi:hypothetical protein
VERLSLFAFTMEQLDDYAEAFVETEMHAIETAEVGEPPSIPCQSPSPFDPVLGRDL